MKTEKELKTLKDFDMAVDCMVCGKRIGFRGFCSQKCHDEAYEVYKEDKKILG